MVILDRIATAIVVLVALIMFGRLVWGSNAGPLSGPPKVPDKWSEEAAFGITRGPERAAVTIVEFIDFQCPGCKKWAARVDSLIGEFPQHVRVIFHHFPLEQHPHALSAAIGAECADEQGGFERFARQLFQEQDSIGTKSMTRFAADAGIPDIPSFSRCIELPPDSFPRIARGRALALANNSPGTPTVWVNGNYVRPSLATMRNMVLTGADGEVDH